MIKNLFIILLLPCLSFGMSKPKSCDRALIACEEVIEAQDQAIVNLRKSVVNLKQQIEEEKKRSPAWMLILGGIAAGVILNSTLGK